MNQNQNQNQNQNNNNNNKQQHKKEIDFTALKSMVLKKGCFIISRPSSGPEPNLNVGFLSSSDSRRSTASSLIHPG
jgi:hypothetical protein